MFQIHIKILYVFIFYLLIETHFKLPLNANRYQVLSVVRKKIYDVLKISSWLQLDNQIVTDLQEMFRYLSTYLHDLFSQKCPAWTAIDYHRHNHYCKFVRAYVWYYYIPLCHVGRKRFKLIISVLQNCTLASLKQLRLLSE